MEKSYVLGHSSHRLRDNFFPCATHVKKPPDPACGANLNELVAPLLFFWDFELGDPQASIDAGHHCFWGQFQLMVNDQGRSIFEPLERPVAIHRAELAEGRDVVVGSDLMTRAGRSPLGPDLLGILLAAAGIVIGAYLSNQNGAFPTVAQKPHAVGGFVKSPIKPAPDRYVYGPAYRSRQTHLPLQ